MNAPCDNCPFLKKGGIRLTHGRVKELVANLSNYSSGGEFTCHKTTVSQEDDEGGSEMVDGPKPAFCGGALIFAGKQGWSNAMMRIAERLGIYDPRKHTLASGRLVFDSEKQMLDSCVDASARGAVRHRGGKKAKPKKPVGTGEPCGVCDEDCTAPAGWDNGNLVSNDEANAEYECSLCGSPVCGACSVERKKKQVCNDCAEEQ